MSLVCSLGNSQRTFFFCVSLIAAISPLRFASQLEWSAIDFLITAFISSAFSLSQSLNALENALSSELLRSPDSAIVNTDKEIGPMFSESLPTSASPCQARDAVASADPAIIDRGCLPYP